jgi:hypothetical protein
MSEVVLHRWRCGNTAPSGTLLIAKACSRILRPVLPSRRELVTRRPVGLMVGLLTLDRLAGRS